MGESAITEKAGPQRTGSPLPRLIRWRRIPPRRAPLRISAWVFVYFRFIFSRIIAAAPASSAIAAIPAPTSISGTDTGTVAKAGDATSASASVKAVFFIGSLLVPVDLLADNRRYTRQERYRCNPRARVEVKITMWQGDSPYSGAACADFVQKMHAGGDVGRGAYLVVSCAAVRSSLLRFDNCEKKLWNFSRA